MPRNSAGARASALLLLFFPLAVRLSADDHFRTGGIVEPEPFVEINAVRVDQRFHIQDVNTLGVQIHYNCHAGDTINPGTLDFVIPAGVAMTWNTGLTPAINWQGTGNDVGSRVAFSGYINSDKTMRFNVTSTFTPITDWFRLTNYGFSFPDPDLPVPATFPKFADNFNLNANTLNGVFPLNHADSAFVRLARPPSGFGMSGPQTLDAGPGPTLMNPVTVTESNTVGNGGIWAATGIKLNIPAGLNMTWHNPGGTVQATCTGGTVPTKIAANPTVSFFNANRTVFIPVIGDFGAGESVTISGLSFANMGNDSTGNLRLNLGNSSAVTVTHATDTNLITITGQPKISSFQSRVYTVGDPTTTMADVTVTESQGTPKIGNTNDITIVLPTALANVCSFAPSNITCTGSAVTNGHISANPGLINPNPGNKSITIPVINTFGSGRAVNIIGLQLTGFTGPLATSNLGLDVNGSVGSFEATDDKTIGIGRPSISSAIDQVFVTSPAIEPMAQITISDDPVNPRIFPGTQIRIAIPTSPVFNMTWQGDLTATTSANLNTGVSYVPGNKILIVTAAPSWTPGGSGTISGLDFSVASASLPDNLELFMNAAGTVTNLDDKIIAVGGVPTMSSGANPTFDQQFTVNDPSTVVNMITLTDAASPSFQGGNSLQIVIPSGLNLEWDQSIAPSIGGTGASHITTPSLVHSYPNAKTLEIFIQSDFSGNQTLTLSNLQFTSFSAASSPLALQMRVTVGGPIAATDNRTKAIGAPSIVSLTNQAFGMGDPTTTAAQITITDDLTTPRIKPGTDIRVRIPSGFNMVWGAAIPTITGTAAGKVSTVGIVGKIMTITVDTPFAGGDTLILNGAQFTSFSGLSGLDNLELEVNNTAGVTPNAFDTSTIKIGTRPTITSLATLDTNGNGSIDRLDVTFSEPINGGTTSVTSGTGFTLAGFTIAVGALDGLDNTLVHFSLTETGLPNTHLTPALTYNPGPGPGSGNLTDLDDTLTMTATTPSSPTSDTAAPVIVNFVAFDDDGDGFLNRVVATFSEDLAGGQADVNDWVLIDANGSTNLLAGVTNTDILISGNTVTINLLDNTGSAGTPRFRYLENAADGSLRDLAATPNFVGVLTNNTAPVASAGPDISAVPTKITLNGSASFDPDGQSVTYSWTQQGGPVVPLVGAGSANPSFQTAQPGAYIFQLDVSDGLAVSSDFVTVNILNVLPTAVGVLDQVVNSGTLVNLYAFPSTDINGDTLSYFWSQVSGPVVAINSAALETANFTPVAPGAYEFALAVTDTAGNKSSTGRVRVIVHVGANVVPTANAGPDQTVASGTPVTLDARLSSSPAPANAKQYTWTAPVLAVPQVGLTPTLTFTPSGPGTYTFTLVVRDLVSGLDSFPDTVDIRVFDPVNHPPAAVATKLSPIGTPTAGEVVTLDATGSVDPEGKPLTYAWFQTGGPRTFFNNPGAVQPAFTPILAGTYEFQLVVFDGVHVSPATSVRFSVKPNVGYVIPPLTASFTTTDAIKANGHVDHTAGTSIQLVSPNTQTWWWEQIAGPAVVFNAFPGNFDPSFIPPTAGLYRFRVTWSDVLGMNRGFRETATVEVIVDDAGNGAPVADAGPSPAPAEEGETVMLDGSLSSDDTTAFGSGLTPYWSQLIGPPVQLSNPYAPQPTFTPTTEGVYVFQLVVNDGTSSSNTSTVQAVITKAPATGGGGGSGGGGGCGMTGLEPMLLIAVAMGWRRRRI